MRLEYKKEQLKDGSKTIANIKGTALRTGTGSTTLCNISGDNVRKGTGSTTLCNVKNGDIRDKTGSSRKARVRDIKKQIRGAQSLSDVFIAAIWQTFLR